MPDLTDIRIDGYEKVVKFKDSKTGLLGFIAIHSTILGPALGGTRFYPYANEEDALKDALRLARGMTFKSAVIQNGLGGGKSVIIGDPKTHKTEDLLRSFGEAVNSLKGAYIAAEDVGTGTADMGIIRQTTPFVAALATDASSGDPSRFTAWGVFCGIRAVAMSLWGTPCLKGKKIAVQGLGNVGDKVANLLFWEGAELILTDVDTKKCQELGKLYEAKIIPPDAIYSIECDIFSPCALGAIVNDKTIGAFKCKAIAGGANNQLAEDRHGEELMQRGILYAPDYVINAGGLINAGAEFNPQGYSAKYSKQKVDHIYDTLLQIFSASKKENKATNRVADELAEHYLKNKIGKREVPIQF